MWCVVWCIVGGVVGCVCRVESKTQTSTMISKAIKDVFPLSPLHYDPVPTFVPFIPAKLALIKCLQHTHVADSGPLHTLVPSPQNATLCIICMTAFSLHLGSLTLP